MFFGFLIIFLLVSFDQITKYTAKFFLEGLNEHVKWIPGVFELSYHENTGASLGILDGQIIILMIVTLIALGIFGYLFLDVDFKHKKVYSFSIVMFIAGTLGNAIDRALLGYVIDFMHYPFLSFILTPLNISNFYNNWADMYLSAAIVLFFIELFFLEPKRKKVGTDA
ncbi:MAG: signal peptidase II [Acholeplasmataceae bacterium]|nr:signal peptidase II [Acholeplasmataceae bacterium]